MDLHLNKVLANISTGEEFCFIMSNDTSASII